MVLSEIQPPSIYTAAPGPHDYYLSEKESE